MVIVTVSPNFKSLAQILAAGETFLTGVGVGVVREKYYLDKP